jgi:pimeloyl-ACP methyl ester carboxylesterase
MTCHKPGHGRAGSWALAVALAASTVALPATARAQGSICADDEKQASGAFTRICMPPPGRWNGDLVVFAHGYVSPTLPVAIPDDQLALPDGTSIPEIVNRLGFGFATTSYSKNGLAVVPGIADVREAVDVFARSEGAPDHVYLVGASEGALVTALAVEQFPEVFSGGLATCGPVGNFRRQINYWGDFRVLFDYFFPGLLPPTAVNVPQDVRDRWNTYYAPLVAAAVASRPAVLDALLRVSRAPFDPADPKTKVETVLGILWYNAFATMDGIATLGGQPFENTTRFYTGSGNDFLLNLRVKRHRAELRALQAIEADYQTSGRLLAPLVTLHTTGDPIVPYWHEPLYSLKALLGGSGLLHANLPVLRYGHCRFDAAQALVALGLLVLEVEGRELLNAEGLLATETARQQYQTLARADGPGR